MHARRRSWLAASAAPLFPAALPAVAGRSLELAAADWAPYSIAGDASRPGIAHEYLRAAFARLGWTLRVHYLPWSRAVHEARLGERIHGLLTAVPAEAEGLLLSRRPSFDYEVGLFTRPDSRWVYRGEASLRQIRLGIVAGYGYGEPLDRHVLDPAQQGRILRLSGGNTVPRLLRLLEIQRIDAFAEDRAVLHWHVRRQGASMPTWREAGRLPAQPVFLALHPGLAGVQALLAGLDRELARPPSRADLERLRRRYLGPLSAAPAESAGSGS